MYDVIFYRNRQNREPVHEFLLELAKQNSKDSRLNLRKIQDYIETLKRFGTRAGEPYVKHLTGELWELRPLRSRIIFVGFYNGTFVLLHAFVKKTQKTPAREIKRAERELADLKERG